MRFQEFTQGFTSSPLEIALSLGFLLLLLVFFILISRYRYRREQETIEQRSQKTYQSLIKRHGLDSEQEGILSQLTTFLRSNERKYMLMENQSIFNSCAEKALEEEILTKNQVSELRVKLGFNRRKSGMKLESSSQIPAESAIIIIQKPHRPVEGKVLDSGLRAFRVHTAVKDSPFPVKSEVELVYHDASGVYAFSTYVMNFSGGIFSFTHSEKLRRVQRREYFRRKISLPCYVHRAGERENMLTTRFIDIGGGGASVINPKKQFDTGDDISISFRSDTENMMHVIGRVIRTSKHNTVLHIDFENMSETRRDRVYRLIFN